MASRYLFSNIQQSMSILPESAQIQCRSQKLLLYYGLLRSSAPGIYTMMPMFVRALDKLTSLIVDHMTGIGGEKMIMPVLGDRKLWTKTGRWDEIGKELFRLQDRYNRDYCLAPTHEEEITQLIATDQYMSYKHLPLKLYQITTKFRDEAQPKYGLLRGREFLMKDMYTFDKDLEHARSTYETVCEAYRAILTRLDIPFVQVIGHTGTIGGSLSHEFHIPATVGEDTLYICAECGVGHNEETLDVPNEQDKDHHRLLCPSCKSDLKESKGIEVGHCFLLGKKYSQSFGATYVTTGGANELLEMGCFGIGVTRLLAAALEVLSTEDHLRWPSAVVPYRAAFVHQKSSAKNAMSRESSEALIDYLSNDRFSSLRGELLIDDRHSSIGYKVIQLRRLGIPWAVVAKANEDPSKFELIDIYNDSSKLHTIEDISRIINASFFSCNS